MKLRRFGKLEAAGPFTREQLGGALLAEMDGVITIDLEHADWIALHPRPEPVHIEKPPNFPLIQARMNRRGGVCEGCDQQRGFASNGWVREVRCEAQKKRCSCPHGEVRLDAGQCPLDRWKQAHAAPAVANKAGGAGEVGAGGAGS